MIIKPTAPIAVVYKDGQPLMPVSLAEADELIRRGHAVQTGGRHIKLYLTERDRKALQKYVLWHDNYTCSCGAKATTVVRIVPRREYGSDFFHDVVIVDEVQFISQEQVLSLARVVDELNIPVLCYGLRSDFRGELFPGSAKLLAIADELSEIKAMCQIMLFQEAGDPPHLAGLFCRN